jgi:hypothetical protein
MYTHTQCQFFPTIRRRHEAKNCHAENMTKLLFYSNDDIYGRLFKNIQPGDENTGKYEVDEIVQGSSADLDLKGHI